MAKVVPIRALPAIAPAMLERILPTRAPFNPSVYGYKPLYRVGEPCACPGCHGTHWLVGRMMAECARCATALPLSESC